MSESNFRELIQVHLASPEPECRWCFAIDKLRVKGEIIAQYDFPDSMLLHLKCPRCNGEFTFYAEVWASTYLKERIEKLHPEGDIELSDEIVDLVFPEYLK